jgi:hypothetical protein
MNERLLLGLISGFVFSVAGWVWYTDFFSKNQKIIIFISLLIPPGAIAVILLISIYNKVTESSSLTPSTTVNQPKNDLSVLEESLVKVKELHVKGVFSDEELTKKTSQIEKQIQSIKEENIQQSFESKVKESEEYKALIVLRSSQVIDGQEFDEKVKKLVDECSQKASSQNYPERTVSSPRLNTTILETNKGKLEIRTKLSAGYTIGDSVYLDGLPAPDGKYSNSWPNWLSYVEVKDGVLVVL